jgi:hypothetical protein
MFAGTILIIEACAVNRPFAESRQIALQSSVPAGASATSASPMPCKLVIPQVTRSASFPRYLFGSEIFYFCIRLPRTLQSYLTPRLPCESHLAFLWEFCGLSALRICHSRKGSTAAFAMFSFSEAPVGLEQRT